MATTPIQTQYYFFIQTKLKQNECTQPQSDDRYFKIAVTYKLIKKKSDYAMPYNITSENTAGT